MKRLIAFAATIVVLGVAVFLLGTGFSERYDVYMADFSVSEDGTVLTMRTGISSSMGYTRGYRDSSEDGAHRLSFYSTFGGMNSSLGAKNEFTLELEPEDTHVYFLSMDGWKLVLEKDEAGLWKTVK